MQAISSAPGGTACLFDYKRLSGAMLVHWYLRFRWLSYASLYALHELRYLIKCLVM